MCGFSLIIDSDGQLANAGKLEPALERMQRQQQHRGPDSEGHTLQPWLQGVIALGSRRLQILDATAAADQPMQRRWRESQGWLSYNGELYNYTDLRNELLQLGCNFSSRSDTEVVLYALLVWGVGALQRFNGMFALAFYQQDPVGRPTLLLARDRWGQKPLYYSRQPMFWLAGSELQGLMASNLLKKELNAPQIAHYLRYKFAEKPQTFFKGVYELEPGHYLQLQPQAEPILKKFVLPSQPLLNAPPSEAHVLELVEELLTDSLINQLQSDKPVGLFLSGGVDSTLMLALLQQHAAWQLPFCFTVGTENDAADSSWATQDWRWAEKAAAQWGAYHHPLQLSSDGLLDSFSDLAARQDQPIADGAWLLTYLLSEHANTRVKAVLSGAGADEQFGGYHRLRAFAAYLQHQQQLMPLLPLLKQGSSLLPTGRHVPGRQLWQLMKKFGSNLEKDPYQTFLNFTSLSILAPAAAAHHRGEEPLQWALNHDRQQFLVSDVLALSDKASMQWGLEMRAPYLDGPLSDYLAQLPAAYLLKGGKKWILKTLLEKHGGKAYGQRNKEGFGMPFGSWVRQGKTEKLWDWLQQKNHPLHEHLPAAITQNLLDKHKNGKADYNQELMALALLAHWLEKNV